MQPESDALNQEPIAPKPSEIEVVGLTKRYGNNSVLDNLNLTVEQGELLVVLGDSGCGKSTLLKLISGLEKPFSGSIRIAHQEQSNVAPHQRDVAVVFQDGNGYEHMTVQRNLQLIAKTQDEKEQIVTWVERLKLGSTWNRRLDQLSGGESQRVAIARAMLSGKSIVLLDEPLSHLNQALREEIRDLILTVHRESQKTFVYVTHDSDEAFYMASRIAVLADGQIKQVGSPRSVYMSPKSKSVALLLGQPTMDVLQLPREWFGLETDGSAPLFECGVRCDQWNITQLSVNETPEGHSGPTGFVMNKSCLEVKGSIADCRWMGSHWLLQIQSSSTLRIRCDAGCDTSLESILLSAEQCSREGRSSLPFGSIAATVPREWIYMFGAVAKTP